MTTETPDRPIPSLLYSDDQEALRAVVRDILADLSPWDVVVGQLDRVRPYDDRLWKQLAAAGIAGLLVPEEFGGSGAGAADMAVALEELGRAVAPVPALSSAVAATVTLTGLATGAAADVVGPLLEAMASGDVVVAPLVRSSRSFDAGGDPGCRLAPDGRVSGQVEAVIGVLGCQRLLVPASAEDDPVLLLVDTGAAGVRVITRPALDMTRPVSTVALDNVEAHVLARGPAATDALRSGLLAATALLASEQLGTAEQSLDVTCEHLRTRFQFGRALGTYQALRHSAAELWTEQTGARAVARYAAAGLDRGDSAADDESALAAHLAAAVCADVAITTTERCLQMMGGIGFTWEHPTHLLLKRAAAGLRLLGTPEAHRLAIGRLRGIATP